jgi:hypothetical protein
MRQQDLDAMRAPYGSTSRRPDDRFGDSLGLDLSDVRKLEDAIFDDLDETVFGIGWWRAYEPQFGVRARIYVSDYMCRCACSIETNLIEARLHLLEAVDAFELENARLGNMLVRAPDGMPVLRTPPSRCAIDDLHGCLSTMHTAGFFRAIASAFDCLGGCVHGVLALNGWIMREASFGAVRGALKNLSPQPQRDVERKELRQCIEDAIAAAGPLGWLDWALHYRHMLVHRARRFELATVTVEPGRDEQGRTVPRTRPIHQLARDPARSDVEMWRDAQNAPVLTESSQATLERGLVSSQSVIATTTRELLRFWNWRKQNVAAIPQPAGAWPNDAAGGVTGFAGYDPTQLPYAPASMSASPVALHRPRVASLADGAHANWPDFGGRGANQ